jgi:pilus assembly protein Flp/PilA
MPAVEVFAGDGTTVRWSRFTGTNRRKGGDVSLLTSVYEMVGALIARMRQQEGQTMAEYGLLLAVIAVVVVAAALILGQSISSLFLGVASSL